MNTRHLLRTFLVPAVCLIALAPVGIHAAPAAAGSWTITGAMHQARTFQTTILLANGLVLVAGGWGINGPTASAELYHPHTGSWATTGSLLHDTDYETGDTVVLLHSGKVLTISGSTTSHGSAELYNPQTGVWTLTGFLHAFPFGQPMTLLTSGQVLVVDGSPPNNPALFLASSELYNP